MSVITSSESLQKPQGPPSVASGPEQKHPLCSIPVGSRGLAWLRTFRNEQCLLKASLHAGPAQGPGSFLSWNLGQDSLLPQTGFRLPQGCTHKDAWLSTCHLGST